MFLTKLEILFFSVVFIITVISNLVSLTMGPTFHKANYLVVISVFITLLLLLLYKFGKIGQCNEPFHFEVTPEKLCTGGPYMISSASKNVQDKCNKIWSTPEGREKLKQVNCEGGMYNGSPVHFEFTPMSNDKWENEMCK